MTALPGPLLEALLHRDDADIEREIVQLAGSLGFDEVLGVVTRFSLLAFAPSEHARAALFGLESLAAVAHRLSQPVRLDQLVELARYAAAARRPWSEAPVTDPPPADVRDGGDQALRSALATRDRLALERWLSLTMQQPAFASRLFRVSAQLRHVMPEALRVTAAAWRLAQGVPAKFRFAVLRVIAVQWSAESVDLQELPVHEPVDSYEEVASRLIRDYAAEGGSPEALARIADLDAMIFAREAGGDASPAADGGPNRQIAQECDTGGIDTLPSPRKDFSGTLISLAIAQRRRNQWHDSDLTLLCRTAVEAAESERWFEEWSIS